MKKLKNIGVSVILSYLFTSCFLNKSDFGISPESEFNSWETTQVLTNEKGFLMKIQGNQYVIVKENSDPLFDLWSCVANPSERFYADNLPEKLKTERETKVVFSGEVKLSPNPSSEIGIPLKLTKIKKQ